MVKIWSSRNRALQFFVILLVTLSALPVLARDENGTTFQAKSATIYYEVLG